MVDPSSARDLVKGLGNFLADLSMDRPPSRVHAEILFRLRQSSEVPDPQLTGIYLDEKDFSAVWTAIRSGASLPVSSWDTVVLPVIAFYSTGDSLKANLETAIHLWGKARTALSTPDQLAIVPVYEVIREDTVDTLALPASPGIVAEPLPLGRGRRPPRRRWWIAMVTTVVALALAGAYVLVDWQPAGLSAQSKLPPSKAPIPTPYESPLPSPSAEPSPTPSLSIAPSTPGAIAPTAPRNLKVIGKTKTSVTLGWQTPAQSGSGGVSHYRLFRSGSDVGVAMGTSHTINGLSPNTAYTFLVKAYNGMGMPSPPSNSLPVTTDPDLKLWTNPGPSITLGESFTVSGSGWPCSNPAQVMIYLNQDLIAHPVLDSQGNFLAPIDVVTEPGSTFVPHPDTSEPIPIYAGTWSVRVETQCAPTPPQSTSVNFIEAGNPVDPEVTPPPT